MNSQIKKGVALVWAAVQVLSVLLGFLSPLKFWSPWPWIAFNGIFLTIILGVVGLIMINDGADAPRKNRY